MALWLRDLTLALDDDESLLVAAAARRLGVAPSTLQDFKIVRRSLDARRKSRILRVYTVEFTCVDEAVLLRDNSGDRNLELRPQVVEERLPHLAVPCRVLIVGMGPAGLFAAKRLAEAGAQVTLIDRGRPVEQRVRDVEAFWASALLDPSSNVQFGEGGAGTFSDGKLTTRLNHPLRQTVLETLVAFGAPRDILVEARPHVGTDKLRKVVIGFRRYLASLGVNLRFETCLTDIEVQEGRIRGGICNDKERYPADAIVLAPGHSARDTYAMLASRGVRLDAKGFALGVRVEHPVELINRIQHGRFAAQLPAADYALRYNDAETGRGVYSFCMCPGGEVINAASEAGGLVVNGMSRSARATGFSNSALVVSVSPDDWDGSALGGIEFQRRWEQLAFRAGGGRFSPPAQNMMAFAGRGSGGVTSSCRPVVVEAALNEVLPSFVSDGLRRALPHFDRQMRGFLTAEAVLIGVETRTSAPLRITRGEDGVSVSHRGLFPAGEGAGYAGGIMSAALDGLRAADQVVQSILNGSNS